VRIHDWNPIQAYNQIQNGRMSSKQVKPDERRAGVPESLKPINAEDRLEISPEAQVISHSAFQGPADRTPSSLSRQARLEALRQQVQAGTYHVPAELVAQKMLRALSRRP